MDKYLVHEILPAEGNPRNGEGSFLRAPDGDILFAYGRFTGGTGDDEACDIAMIRSHDGVVFGEPEIIARAEDFGVGNIMSVSGLTLPDGRICFWFLIKENDGTSTLGRTMSTDGKSFMAERCECLFPREYYVVNNDRFEIMSDGRIAVPAASHRKTFAPDGRLVRFEGNAELTVFVSDDGYTFREAGARCALPSYPFNRHAAIQEPGIYERPDGVVVMWARTTLGSQYMCASIDRMHSFTVPGPSEFTSPCSPMEIYQADGRMFAAYNPIPNYNGRCEGFGSDRTPLVIRVSEDGGQSFGGLNVIGEDPERGYCYPAMFVSDRHLLLSVCRGRRDRCLTETGIYRIPFGGLI